MRRFTLAAVAAFLSVSLVVGAAELSAEITSHLEKDPYVYISSMRKSGEFGTPAEIWFSWDGKTVLVGTSVKSYRVKRIKAGRPSARIAVENAEGPSFDATGALVDGKEAQEAMIAAFAKKYGESFTDKWQAKFREGFASGTRILVRYTPKTGDGG